VLEYDDREQHIRIIRDSVEAVGPPGDLSRIRRLRFTETGFEAATWRTICNLGWPGLRLPEVRGGAGLGMTEFCALTEELGRRLVPEPLIEVAMAAEFLGDSDVERLLRGEFLVLPAWQEGPQASVRVEAAFRQGRLNGRKSFIPAAGGADGFVVLAREGPVLVRRTAPGVSLSLRATQDGGHYGELILQDAVGDPCFGDFTSALRSATLATAAYLLGVMEQAFAITLDYLRLRQQFGRPIGSFQALQHRAADLKLCIALTRASVEAAANLLDSAGPEVDQTTAVRRAKSRAGDAALRVAREAIQLHGAVGYTDEHDIGLYLRKAMTLANRYGSAHAHRAAHAIDRYAGGLS
jgi:alkylation response protein AidB-like acyl-CoA dehydrogenase